MGTSVKRKHPGWSVRFSDGTWLAGAHGWFRTDDAFYADIFESEDDANHYWKQEFSNLEADIIPAWEPACEHLRLKVSTLESANKVSPDEIFDLQMGIESILNRVKRWG